MSAAPEVVDGVHNIGVHGPRFSALFSRLHGGLVSYRYGPTAGQARELLRQAPYPNFWHAPTANERGWQMPYRDGQWSLASRYRRVADGPMVELDDDTATVAYRYSLPTTPESNCAVTYRIFANGRIEITTDLQPGVGLPDPPEFGWLFVTDADFGQLQWYGQGPQECYADRQRGARLGVYEAAVADQLTAYLRPQEAGSHTQVRWASVTDQSGHGLRFECDGTTGLAEPTGLAGLEFSALPWTPFEIENASHSNELPPIVQTVCRPALARRGVGGDDSWGAMTHPEYRLPTGPLTFRFAFQGV